MKKQSLCAGLIMTSALMTLRAAVPAWDDPQVNEINRLPMRASYFAFPAGENVSDKTASANYLSLDGTWRFHYVDDRDKRPGAEVTAPGYDDSSWVALLRMGFTCALSVTVQAVVSYTAFPPLPGHSCEA